MDQCPNVSSFRSRVPIYQRENQVDCQNKLRDAIPMNGEIRVALNSISKGENVVILNQFCVTVERMLCLDKVQFYFPNKWKRWSNGKLKKQTL